MPPVAVDDSATTNEDTPVTINVLANDTDVDGDALTVSSVTQGTNGAVTIADNKVTYTPNADFNGTDSFTYKAKDGSLDSNDATVTITVNAVNDAPVAVDDSATTDEDTSVTIDVLANDTDVDGGALTVSSVTQGTNGAVTIADNKVTYTPNADFNGTDTFTYTVNDGNAGTDTATVNITVNAVNDAPVADAGADQTVEATSSDGAEVTMGGTGSSDIDGDKLTHTWNWDSSTASGVSPTILLPLGTTTVTLTVSDGELTDTNTVTITVIPVSMSKFQIDHAKLDFKKKPDDDKIHVKGKLELDVVNGNGVDISESVTVTVGPLSETIMMLA